VPPEGLWAYFLRQTHVPFYYQYWLDDSFDAARNILTQFGVFLALGLFVRASTEMFARGNRFLPSLLMVLLSAALEAGRLLIPDQIADVTMATIGAAGGIAGVLAYTMILHVFVYGKVYNKSCDS
jgi:Na+/melibiose symporter-like transporter